MVLLAICVGALLIGVLRLATQRPTLPAASSSSAAPDGALALYTWIDALGGRTERLGDTIANANVGTLLILEPQGLFGSQDRSDLEALADQGATVVLAGESIQWLVTARSLGVTVEPVTAPPGSASSADGLRLPFFGRYRLRDAAAQPLLVADDGDWVGLRKPYRGGTLVVIASAGPFTNAGLADTATARFVFREVVAPAVDARGSIGFDEVDRGFTPNGPGPATINQLLLSTAPGRAALYVGLVLFASLILGSWRLGPAVVARSAAESQRTMYEHVQMLADLYRRAGQLAVVRETFAQRYARLLARGAADARRSARLDRALARVRAARTESELVAAVASADDDAG
jgi:hypothetical protein